MKKKAYITGGDRGIGRGIGIALAAEGYDIAFSYFEGEQNVEESVRYTKKKIEEAGRKCYPFAADFSVKENVRPAFDYAVEKLGGLDLMVNNAGVNKPLPVYELTDENFDYLVNLDYRAYIMNMAYTCRYMIDHGIRGISSISPAPGESGHIPMPGCIVP